MYTETEKAVERAKRRGPTLIECVTYRHLGHWTGDPQNYRSREEVEEWKNTKDPIVRMRARLLADGTLRLMSWTQ